MITVNLKGGLGNQMFQYACGRALALHNGDELRLVAEGLEKANAVGDIYRPFSLQKFTIAGEVINGKSVPVLQRIISRIESKIFRKFYINFDSTILNKKGDVFLNGYFQSEKYFKDIAEIIRGDFVLREELQGDAKLIATQMQSDRKAVALHCRRGDYVTHPEFGDIANLNYYQRAIAAILELVPEANFYVFSDDIVWCQDTLPLPKNVTFVSSPLMKDYEELYLMSLCQHNIIANSSFSWWGAWLNAHPNKIVIAPQRWSQSKDSTDFKDIIPKDWMRV